MLYLPIYTLNLDNIWSFRLEVTNTKLRTSLKHNNKMIFFHCRSVFDIKIKKAHKNSSRSVEMFAFGANIYCQLKSTSLGYVQTDINHHMVIRIDYMIDWLNYMIKLIDCQYIQYFKNFSEKGHVLKIRLFQQLRL